MSLLDKRKADFKILDRPDVPVRKYAAGETIVTQGSIAREMYFLRRGRVAIDVGGKTVAEVAPGGVFGEMALIDHSPRSASAVAIVDSDVVPIDERLFVILVQDSPYFALDIMRVLAERIRAMNQLL